MDSLQAIILALLQGITEFLPISSSAHLILPSQLLGWPDQGLAFDVAVHVGTLVAVVTYFRHDLLRLSRAWLTSLRQRQRNADADLAWMVIVATVPAGLAGLLGNDFIETHLRAVWVIASTTVLFALLLAYADRFSTHQKQSMGFSDAVWIGVAQALALIPGTSRSGITMTAALLLGYSRTEAARFSFLLSIPLILAAGSLKTAELIETGTSAPIGPILLGTVVAAVSAYLCIRLFLGLLERLGFMPFVIYRLALGGLLFALLALGYV